MTTAAPEVDLDDAYRRSCDLLSRNACGLGFLAAPVDRRNYRALWARDACVCAAAAYVCGEEDLVEAARETLRTLAGHQADNGQVPSYILVNADDSIEEVNYGGWGEVTSIDSSLWFIIACQTVFRQRHEEEFIHDRLLATYRAVIRYLQAIDANSCGLLEVPIAGDWTDILNRSYHILYDQVLWYRALTSAAELSEYAAEGRDEDYYAAAAERVCRRLNDDFWWDNRETVERVAAKYKIRNDLPESPDLAYYQSHLEPFLNNWFTRFDAFANTLAALMGVAPTERVEAILATTLDRGLDQPYPLRVLDPPIEESDPDAHQLRLSDEPPFGYHNGGIWPLAGGFWTVLLSRVGRKDEARAALQRLAQALRRSPDDQEEWGFYEYLHGKTHEPQGTRLLSWNGAAYLLAYHAVINGRFAAFAGGDRPHAAR